VQLRDIADPETNQRYTAKRYKSTKERDGTSWRHTTIRLRPTNPAFSPIVLDSSDDSQVKVVAEFIEAVGVSG